ncbi:MAG: hypothetical protein M3N12_01665 [Verrucomicrobiota bacterium]|nr:hypothetical protein [Verrucomicrobiota bacterium]
MFSTWVGVVLLFAFFGLLALVVLGAAPRGTKYEKTRAKARVEKLKTLNEQNTNALKTYAWVDKTKGTVRIPINDAMKLTVAELSQKKPAPANPIATPDAHSPAPTTATAPTTASPAPSPSAAASGTPKPTAVKGPNSENANQAAAANNPPPAPPGTQPGPSTAPAASPPSAPAKAATSPSPKASPSAPGTPLPVRGKTP